MKGIIIKGIAGFYYVKTNEKVYQCKARGKFKNIGISPVVGDMVDFEVLENKEGVIVNIHPRNNIFIRPPISNVDCIAIVISAAQPDPNYSILDRFLVMAEEKHTSVIICVNKTDLGTKEKINEINEIYGGIYPILFTSCIDDSGLNDFKKLLSGKKCALAGPSGVGKSTILNHFIPQKEIETGEISTKTKRGKHTTRHVEIFETDFNALLFDTPGFTSFDILEAQEEQLQYYYPEMEPYINNCKYDNCRHLKEPDCAVIAALKDGMISNSRYSSYLEQMTEIREKKRN